LSGTARHQLQTATKLLSARIVQLRLIAFISLLYSDCDKQMRMRELKTWLHACCTLVRLLGQVTRRPPGPQKVGGSNLNTIHYYSDI